MYRELGLKERAGLEVGMEGSSADSRYLEALGVAETSLEGVERLQSCVLC